MLLCIDIYIYCSIYFASDVQHFFKEGICYSVISIPLNIERKRSKGKAESNKVDSDTVFHFTKLQQRKRSKWISSF